MHSATTGQQRRCPILASLAVECQPLARLSLASTATARRAPRRASPASLNITDVVFTRGERFWEGKKKTSGLGEGGEKETGVCKWLR